MVGEYKADHYLSEMKKNLLLQFCLFCLARQKPMDLDAIKDLDLMISNSSSLGIDIILD